MSMDAGEKLEERRANGVIDGSGDTLEERIANMNKEVKHGDD